MKAVMQTLLFVMLVSLGLTGCGQKGDLFLPAEKPAVATPAKPEAATVPPAEQQQPEPILPTQPANGGTGTEQSVNTAQQAQQSTSNTKR